VKLDFWEYLQKLVISGEIVIDHPKGSTHHRYMQGTYPVDYGYLRGTTTLDGSGVDIWIGSLGHHQVKGVLCCVDLLKKDTESKILYDCTEEEIQSIINFVNVGQMRAIYINKEQEYGVDT
jgi:inorganic pyrophosphatase